MMVSQSPLKTLPVGVGFVLGLGSEGRPRYSLGAQGVGMSLLDNRVVEGLGFSSLLLFI